MKKILFFFSFCLLTKTTISFAQQMEIQRNPPNWPFMLSNLTTTQITSGILYNKTGMFTTLYDYNRGNYNISHADHYMQAINELYYASDQTRFVSAKQLKANLANATIDIGIINTTIHQLNFNEKDPSTGGLTFANGKFSPIAGRPSFLERKIFLASPLKEMISGANATYTFSNAQIYNNATSAIRNLVVYFNDATPVTVIDNGNLLVTSKTINYTTSETKTLKFVATFQDNTSITTYAYHYFDYNTTPVTGNGLRSGTANSTQANCNYGPRDRGVYKSAIAFQGYNESQAYYGKFDYSIFYHTNNGNTEKKMLKPIVIIDGFDPGDTRKTTDCDCENDPACATNPNYTDVSITFPSGLFPHIQTVFNPNKHESIEDNMIYNESPILRLNLITTLRELGYDVIVLNIPTYNTSAVGSTVENKTIDGGADYVERNGLALASYLKNTKSLLVSNGSNADIVIMGPSMGGLISRYALAYMDKKLAETNDATWKHNTRLWVSFDSPHLGANIPIAAQANIWFLGEELRNSKAEEKFNNTINSIAAKQMLISQFSHVLNTANNGVGYSNNSPFFTQFQNNLTNNGLAGSGGFPVSTPTFRKIAIVNGSLSGSKYATEGSEFLNIRGYKDPTFFEGLIGGSIIGSVVPFLGTIGGGIAGGILGATNANVTVLRVQDKFSPGYGQTADVFNGDGQNFDIGWSHWYINHKWYNLKGTNNDIRGSLDVVPAGTFNTGKIIKDDIVDGLDKAGLSSEVRGTYYEGHSFIPSFSSLAHLQPNQSWSNPLNYNLACQTNKQTPFDSYFGASSNTGHITLTKDMVDWLLGELAGNPQVPVYPMDANSLNGPNLICENTNTTFGFDDICRIPSAATWSVSPNLQIVSSTAYTIVVKGMFNGEGKITATFQNGQKVEKVFRIGRPVNIANNYISGAYDNVSITSTSTLTINPVPTATSYQWNLRTISTSSGSTSTCRPAAITYQNGTMAIVDWGTCLRKYEVNVQGVNQCGANGLNYREVNVFAGSGGGGNPCNLAAVQVFPNPIKQAGNEVNVIYPPCDNLVSAKTSSVSNTVEIYNFYGYKIYSRQFETNEIKINDLNLSKGNYIINISNDKGDFTRKILAVE